jgi:5-methylcytosine-specific restriction endonuclease McrA
MTKEEYRTLLAFPQWGEKRLEILKRDQNKCCKCSSTIKLEIHHKYYLEGKLPWEYANSCYQTLCRKCHRKKHKGKAISSFIRTPKRKKKNNNQG